MRCTIKDKENAYYPAGALASRPGAFCQQGTGRWDVSFRPISKPHPGGPSRARLGILLPSWADPFKSAARESIFMRPEKPPHGLPIYHRFMRFETLRSSKDTLLRHFEANLTSFFPCLSCEAWGHADRRVRLARSGQFGAWGNPNKRAAISKRISPLIACLRYFQRDSLRLPFKKFSVSQELF